MIIPTVVKANFKSTGQGAAKAKAGMKSLRYFSQRPNWETEQADREIVTREGRFRLDADGESARLELQRQLEQSHGEHLYRVVLSSGDKQMTAYETERWARNVLEKNQIHNYMLVVHAGEQGHTQNPHAHVLIPTSEKFNVEQLQQMRQVGDEEQKQISPSLKAVPLRTEIEVEQKTSGKAGGRAVEEENESQESGKRKAVDIQLGH